MRLSVCECVHALRGGRRADGVIYGGYNDHRHHATYIDIDSLEGQMAHWLRLTGFQIISREKSKILLQWAELLLDWNVERSLGKIFK